MPRWPLSRQFRHEEKHHRYDCINRHELHAFIPVGLAVASGQVADQHRHEQGTGLCAVESKLKGPRRDEVIHQHEYPKTMGETRPELAGRPVNGPNGEDLLEAIVAGPATAGLSGVQLLRFQGGASTP